nr:unnamed protein product [Callosobruchus analis]
MCEQKCADPEKVRKSSPPDPPEYCCMNQCENCPWIEYGEKLAEYYSDGGKSAIAKINQEIQGESMKAFLVYEIQRRLNKNDTG